MLTTQRTPNSIQVNFIYIHEKTLSSPLSNSLVDMAVVVDMDKPVVVEEDMVVAVVRPYIVVAHKVVVIVAHIVVEDIVVVSQYLML